MNQTLAELLKTNYFFLFYFALLILSLFRYRMYFASVLKYFPIFIGYTILTEVLGYIILNFDDILISYSKEYPYSNNAIYNIYDLVFFFYFYYIFYTIVKDRKSKVFIKCGAVLYIAASTINPFFENWIIFPQTYAAAVGSVVLITCILLYFMDSKYRKEKNKNLLVWISIGLLIFNLFFPIIMLIALYNIEFYREFHLRQVHHVLIVAMYSCFMVGFLQLKGNFMIEEDI